MPEGVAVGDRVVVDGFPGESMSLRSHATSGAFEQ